MNIEIKMEGSEALQKKLAEYAKKSPEKARKAVNYTLYDIQGEAKSIVHKKTSTLASHIEVEMDSTKAEGVCGTNIKYAPGLEYGTAPHEIRPVTKKALYWKGAEHPVKVVHHPGNPPYPFLRPAYLSKIGNLIKYLKEEFGEI